MEASDRKELRVILDNINALNDEWFDTFPTDEGQTCIHDALECEIIKADKILAKPPRNCDVGTADEQAKRYHNFTDRYNPCSYKGYARCAEDCPVHIKLMQEGHGELLCQLEWAQMPYEEEEARNEKSIEIQDS